MSMFCQQCEQTAGGKGCTVKGVCGKESGVAALQDLLLFALRGIAFYGKKVGDGKPLGVEADRFMMQGLFATITNVDFDPARLQELIFKAYKIKNQLKITAKLLAGETVPACALWVPAETLDGLIEQGNNCGWLAEKAPADILSLKEILVFGLKGMAAYADHAAVMGKYDDQVNRFFYKGLAAIDEPTFRAEQYLDLIMEFGKINLKCLQILDEAHTARFGNPVPTKVALGVRKGPAIIISGHDLPDLEELLKQTENKGVNIYTHGEMIPAHGYPGLKKYKHLAGHFGTAWQNQQKEFDGIPAVILMTTNCIQKPQDSYKDRIFTTGLVAWPQVVHIEAGVDGKKDFSLLIKKALDLGGFTQDTVSKEILVGFAHNAVLSAAGKIVEAVKAKKIRHFFLVGGCDGAKPGRNYYTEFAQKVPADCMILTLACGKFRFNSLDFGYIGDFPRLLDCGQCNDAYSAIKIAEALAEAFNCSVNDLPLSLVLSWYEQKAVCILLTLFSLGIKNIRLGPSLPAFVSPGVLNILVEKFGVKPITNPEQDLKSILG